MYNFKVENNENKIMKNNKGFTLIEMLVVIAVIGILSAATLTALGPARNKAKDTRIISGLNQARALAETMSSGNYSTLPGGADTIITIPSSNVNFGTIVSDITTQGGSLRVIHDVDGTDSYYVFYSPLSTSGEFYCMDNKGASKKESTEPVPPATGAIGACL